METGISLSTIKSMATMLGVKFPTAEPPSNAVSEFMNDEIDKILPEGADPEIVSMIKGVYINTCNHDPNQALQTLIMVHEDIGELVRGLQEQSQAEKIVEIIKDDIDKEDEIVEE